MNYMSPIEQELESILNTEAEFDAFEMDAEDDGMEDQLVLLEQITEDDEDDFPEVDLEPYDSDDWGESYAEGPRREKANRSRSLKNRSRSMTNRKNILKINGRLKKIQRKTYVNAKQVKAIGKKQRIQTLRNGKTFKRLRLNQKRFNRMVKVVNQRTGANTRRLDQASAMAFPKAVAAIFSVIGETFPGKVLPSIVAELSVLVPPNKKLNKWAVAGIASVAVMLGGLLGNQFELPAALKGK